MESWAYASQGKDLLFSDEMDLSVDAFARSRKTSMGWDKESVESLGFIDLSFSELPKKPLHVNEVGVGIFGGGDVGIDSAKLGVISSPTCIIGSNSSFESGPKYLNSFVESNSQDSSLIDLKLGRMVDGKDAQSSKFYKERSILSFVNPTVQAKRARTISSRLQTPFCQVYGCNKDLSSSKDYHKRHKVCEVHSKTPKVIVNGIEQRFCQQCSRFHLLVEFDDGKRSCRKRLAGHNERRRKPQFNTPAVKPHKLLQSYQGTKFLGASLPKRSPFLFPNILTGGILYPENIEQSGWCRNVKSEEKETYIPPLSASISNGQSFLPSSLHLRGNGIQCTSGISSSVTEDHTVFNTASTIHELAGVSHSSRALSLLSAESQDLSYSLRDVMARPLISQSSHTHHSFGISDRPCSSEKYIPNGFLSSGTNSNGVNHMSEFMISDNGHSANLQVQADGFVQGSDYLNVKYSVSPEHGCTVDLLQLSSHLQRVEQQRNSMHVKQENEFCNSRTTYGL